MCLCCYTAAAPEEAAAAGGEPAAEAATAAEEQAEAGGAGPSNPSAGKKRRANDAGEEFGEILEGLSGVCVCVCVLCFPSAAAQDCDVHWSLKLLQGTILHLPLHAAHPCPTTCLPDIEHPPLPAELTLQATRWTRG